MNQDHVGVIGVDTHRDTHTAVALSYNGGLIDEHEAPANASGYQQMLTFGTRTVPGQRRWAIEGTGS